jgi:hypothetical protein
MTAAVVARFVANFVANLDTSPPVEIAQYSSWGRAHKASENFPEGGLGVMKKFIIAVVGFVLLAANLEASAAADKCTSLQARCAIEVGGKCNPNTGGWCYGWWKGQRCGSGTIQAFDACISRGLPKR